MATTDMNITKMRKRVPYESESFKDGVFTENELKQYGLSENEIATVIDYQALLPILQTEDADTKVNARDLHKQLCSGQKFTDWIENRIKSYHLIDCLDYFSISEKYEIDGFAESKTILNYHLTLDCAKQLAMVERSNIGALVRRYFITIEKALKNRIKWNSNRKNTLINCKELRLAIITKREELLNGLPEWMNGGNLYAIEFSLLNSIILGMSATQYRTKNSIAAHDPIRNYFSDDQLDDIERLERYSAQLILAQEIYSYDSRKKMLEKEYSLVKDRQRTYT